MRPSVLPSACLFLAVLPGCEPPYETECDPIALRVVAAKLSNVHADDLNCWFTSPDIDSMPFDDGPHGRNHIIFQLGTDSGEGIEFTDPEALDFNGRIKLEPQELPVGSTGDNPLLLQIEGSTPGNYDLWFRLKVAGSEGIFSKLTIEVVESPHDPVVYTLENAAGATLDHGPSNTELRSELCSSDPCELTASAGETVVLDGTNVASAPAFWKCGDHSSSGLRYEFEATISRTCRIVDPVSVTMNTVGDGSVSASVDPMNCTGSTCRVRHGSEVSLVASEDHGFDFVGWSGCSDSTLPEITLTPDSDIECTATFEPQAANTHTITIEMDADSADHAMVSAAGSRIDCPDVDCSDSFAKNSDVRLIVVPRVPSADLEVTWACGAQTLTGQEVTIRADADKTCTVTVRATEQDMCDGLAPLDLGLSAQRQDNGTTIPVTVSNGMATFTSRAGSVLALTPSPMRSNLNPQVTWDLPNTMTPGGVAGSTLWTTPSLAGSVQGSLRYSDDCSSGEHTLDIEVELEF